MKEISRVKCFGGWLLKLEHQSEELGGLQMRLNVFLPPTPVNAVDNTPAEVEYPLPRLLYFLSGLTCTEDNFMQKAGALQYASKYHLAICAPDTSPRKLVKNSQSNTLHICTLGGANIEGEDDNWDFGTGAGFYVDATADPWSKHYRMYSYITQELPQILAKRFSEQIDFNRLPGICGHSMGGHGALMIYLRNSDKYNSVSAFSPICNPSNCPWGKKAFSGYLGADNYSQWSQYDATELVQRFQRGSDSGPVTILIDQGSDDQFLHQDQLLPSEFIDKAAGNAQNVRVVYREHKGYDHGYYFISTFIEDHIRFHALQ